jgi:hypothetical protein
MIGVQIVRSEIPTQSAINYLMRSKEEEVPPRVQPKDVRSGDNHGTSALYYSRRLIHNGAILGEVLDYLRENNDIKRFILIRKSFVQIDPLIDRNRRGFRARHKSILSNDIVLGAIARASNLAPQLLEGDKQLPLSTTEIEH